MNHTPLIHSTHAMTLAAIALSCPFVQAGTAGYLSTSSAAGTSEVGPAAVYEGQSAQDSINLRQITLRKEKTREAMRLLQEGRTAYTDHRYKDALDKYQAAWDAIPKAPATQRQQEFIIASIGDASIAVAIEYAKVARYDDAEQLLQDVLLRDPNNRRAAHELSLLRDPVRNNPANSPENVRNVQEVQRLLELGYGYYDLGKYDDAYAEANRVLQIDPYNSAARRLQEQCSLRKSTHYYPQARNAHRAKMLADVDATWEEALPTEMADMEVSAGSTTVNVSPDQIKNAENLDKIQISSVSFENVTVEEALDFMRAEARKAGVSINFMYMPLKAAAPAPAPAASEDEEDEEAAAAPAPVASAPANPEIANLNMREVSAKDLLQMICKLTDCSYRIEDKAVVIYQKGAEQGNISMRKWKVAPSFFSNGGDEESDDEEDDGFAADSRPKGKKLDAMASLKEKGALFKAKGSSARYDRATNTLIVYSTPDDLDMVEEAVNEFRRQLPRMVKVSTKFMEVSQSNEEELSFDWVVNPFSVSNSGNMYLGGVSGQNSNPNRTVSDFVSSGGTAYANNYNGNGSWPITGSNSILSSATDTIGNGLVTGGLRTGTGAISANSMDSLLTAGSAAVSSSKTPAPGILALSGIYDSGSFQAIMRGLSQKKGVDVMSAPSLVLSPGDIEWTPDPDPLASYQNDDDSCAKIEVIRRFIYPTAYDAPEIDAGSGRNNNNNNNNNNNYNTGGVPVASPANPSEWSVEEVGIVMRVRVEDDNAQMDDIIRFKHFEIRVVGFEGFVNYGSPITVGITARDRIEHITLTDNRIDMPIFSRRFINSNPKIYDGHTIAIGGMIEDNVQKVEDKVPVFGDLPLIGRFFRSEAESHVRKNLMIFVTAEYIDPTGRPIRHRDTGTGDSPTASAVPGLFPDEGLANP